VTEEKLGPGEAWGAIEEMLTADEAARVSALSDAQLDEELAKKGLDPAELRARGEALARELAERGEGDGEEGAEGDPADGGEGGEAADAAEDEEDEDEDVVRELPPPSRPVMRPRWATWAVAGAVAAAVALPLFGIPMVRRVMFQSSSSPAAPLASEASALRTEGLHDCEERRWLECWRKLDAAKALDPAGDDADEVREARADIRKALEPKEP